MFHRRVQTRLQRAQRNLQNLGDVLVCKAMDVLKEECSWTKPAYHINKARER